MGSARFGMVADALSQGLGLFVGKKAEEERDRVRHQWDLALADMREKNASAREGRQYAHSEALAATSSEAATARHAETQQRIVGEGELNRGARREEFDMRQVADAEEMLFKRMDALRDERAEALENAFGVEADEGKINRRYQGLMDDMILGHVIRLGEGNAPGYEINDAGALESKFLQMGMDPDGAKQHSINIGESLWPTAKDPNAPEPFIPSGNFTYTEGPERNLVTGGTGNPNTRQQTAAASKPVDMVSPESSIPQQGDNSLFGPTPRNPDGSVANRITGESIKSLGTSIFDWMQRPTTELFGK